MEALRRDDADVSIVFMTANGIGYQDKVHDPFFAADQDCYWFMENDRNFTFCSPNHSTFCFACSKQTSFTLIYLDVNVMACADQHQFCNPNNDRCTDLTSYSTAIDLAITIGFNAVQLSIVDLLAFQLYESSLDDTLARRGGSALRAQEMLHDIISDPLPDDQWMIEVDSWFNTGLVRLQKFVVGYAAGPRDVIDPAYILKPDDSLSKSMCRNQKVHSTGGTINFSVLGLALVVIICSILILTNLVLETIVGFIQRRYKTGSYRRLQWIVDGKLQLQRMAFEAAGMGTWSGGATPVPITRLGEKFGLPRDTDPDHPRLQDYMKAQGGGGRGEGDAGEEIELARLIRHKTNSTETSTQHQMFEVAGVWSP